MQPEPPPESASPGEREKPRARPGQSAAGSPTKRWAGGILLALVLYILSTGPALKLAKAGYLSQETLNVVYAPIIWSRQTELGDRYLYSALRWYWEIVWEMEPRVEN
jgi:hypothetical protein